MKTLELKLDSVVEAEKKQGKVDVEGILFKYLLLLFIISIVIKIAIISTQN